MRRLFTLAFLLVLGLVAVACSGDEDSESPAPTEASSPDATITIQGFSYSGADSVSVGDTVEVTNQDTVGHTWTATDGGFDSGTLGEGESFELTFEEAGEFDYFCSIHPEMAGSITVEG